MAKYIDADELTDVLNSALRWLRGLENTKPEQKLLQYIKAKLEEMPAADVAPARHGKWLNPNHTPYVQCSLCGRTVATNWRGFYCQHCGAKMDGGESNG